MKAWIREHRKLRGRLFIRALNWKLIGYCQYFGLRTNSQSLSTFYYFTIGCAFKWLNRRSGKKSSFTWQQFNAPPRKPGIALPRIVGQPRHQAVIA
jgi:hypothetical protein